MGVNAENSADKRPHYQLFLILSGALLQLVEITGKLHETMIGTLDRMLPAFRLLYSDGILYYG